MHYIIEQVILNTHGEEAKINYYSSISTSDGWFTLFVDDKDEAKAFDNIEDAQKVIEVLKCMHFISDAWRYKYKIVNLEDETTD